MTPFLPFLAALAALPRRLAVVRGHRQPAMGLSDPRTYGSGNPGATNVLRSGSKAAAILTLAPRRAEGLRAGRARRSLRAGARPRRVARSRWSRSPPSSATSGRCSSASAAARASRPRPARCSASIRCSARATLATWLIIAAFFRYSSLASIVAAVFAPFWRLLTDGAGPIALALLAIGAAPGLAPQRQHQAPVRRHREPARPQARDARAPAARKERRPARR